MPDIIVQSQNSDWRQHWFVVNFLAEMPIIGSFFEDKTLSKALHDAGKCTSMLVGGTTSMMTILAPAEEDNEQIRIAKMAISMAIGMTTGKVLFNVVRYSGEMLYHYTSKNFSSSHSVELETVESESLNPAVKQTLSLV